MIVLTSPMQLVSKLFFLSVDFLNILSSHFWFLFSLVFFWSNDKESSLVTSVRFYTVEILAAGGTNGGATIPRYAERCVRRDQNDVLKKKSREKVIPSMYGFYMLLMGFLC